MPPDSRPFALDYQKPKPLGGVILNVTGDFRTVSFHNRTSVICLSLV